MGTAAVHPAQSVKSSDLSRNPQAVFAAADVGPVEITRRDGESFLLSSLRQAQRQNQGIGVAAEVLSVLLENLPIDRAPLERVFPWLRLFTSSDADAFRKEFVEVTRACAAVGQYDHLLLTVNAWEATARALADGLRAEPEELGWLEESVRVEDPRA